MSRLLDRWRQEGAGNCVLWRSSRRQPAKKGKFARHSSLRIEPLEARIALARATVADDFANDLGRAAQINLDSWGNASIAGTINTSGDVDCFRLTANVTGRMIVTQKARSSAVDSYVYAYNSSQRLITSNNNNGSSKDSYVEFDVKAGTVYYLKAAANGKSTGAYTLGIVTALSTKDDFANTFSSAASVTMTSAGGAMQDGVIERAGDVDMFRFTATVTGRMTITQAVLNQSRVDPYLYVYDANQKLLASNDDIDTSTLNGCVAIDVKAGATYYVKAAAYGNSTGAYRLTFATATSSTPTPTTGNFQITLSLSGLTTNQQSLARQAAGRWESVIVGDLPDVVYNGQRIDDVVVTIVGEAIDGTGGILGQAGPEAYRTSSYLPCAGSVTLDTADMASMERNNTLLDVMTHEIGHVLGFGIFWSELGLLTGANTSNPQFTGRQATAEYNALFGTQASGVPVEAGGGQGTALSHWRESVFDTELMTGWIDAGGDALSRITVAAMADIGYQVNMAAAQSFTRPASRTATASVAGRQSVVAWTVPWGGIIGCENPDRAAAVVATLPYSAPPNVTPSAGQPSSVAVNALHAGGQATSYRAAAVTPERPTALDPSLVSLAFHQGLS